MFSLWIHYLDADVVVPVKCKQMAGSFAVLFTTDFHYVSSHRVSHWSLGAASLYLALLVIVSGNGDLGMLSSQFSE